MKTPFQRIGLIAKQNSPSIIETFERLIAFLAKRGHTLTLEAESATLLSKQPYPLVSKEELSENDLVIVVGGDGSLLKAARAITCSKTPILGINRGRLGFLADILPQHMEKELTAILEGNYVSEARFLLKAKVIRQEKIFAEATALNDVVLYSSGVSRMIDFEVYVNQHFVLRQQADGIIVATPTGSTAYALSAGGPVVYPTLNAITLAPMCPHTLSSRPIVVEGNSKIKLLISSNNNKTETKLSCDGQTHFALQLLDTIEIEKYEHELCLIHPANHNYYTILREKLGWHITPIKD
jgi:NAD+ kinase